MRATLSYIQQKFEEFNQLCFEGKLPPVPIVLSNARTYLGVCAYKTKRDLLMRRRHYDFRLRISTRFDLPEEEIADTLLHEMIHYHIAYNHLKDTSCHGKLFRAMMNDFNARFGRHITISHRLSEEQRLQYTAAKSERRTCYCMAIMRFKDGRVGIKVIGKRIINQSCTRSLPSNTELSIMKFITCFSERMVEFYRVVMKVIEIDSVMFCLTSDSFFSRYPCSMALKAYFIDAPELKGHLQQAVCYSCNGKELYWLPSVSWHDAL